MRTKLYIALAAATLFCGAQVQANVLFSDGFESYNLGKLSTTDTASPNNVPGNLWWSPGGNNGHVTGAVNGVTPHSGSQMLIGNAPGDFDQNVINLAYEYGGQAPIPGNLSLDFWFYDANGAGDANSVGYAELGYYDGVPSNAEYNSGHHLSAAVNIQRVILGTSNASGADLGVYQARLLGDSTPTVGTGFTNNYINTTAARTVGWHEGTIDIGPQLAGGGNLVNFYIDNTLCASATTSEAFGYNVLVLNTQLASSASTMNYFDDITLSSVPEPASLGLLAAGAMLGVIRRRRVARA